MEAPAVPAAPGEVFAALPDPRRAGRRRGAVRPLEALALLFTRAN